MVKETETNKKTIWCRLLYGGDARFDWSNESQLTALRDDGQTVLTMVVDEVTDTVEDEVFCPDLRQKGKKSKISDIMWNSAQLFSLIGEYSG